MSIFVCFFEEVRFGGFIFHIIGVKILFGFKNRFLNSIWFKKTLDSNVNSTTELCSEYGF
jgi:hypothetical protein